MKRYLFLLLLLPAIAFGQIPATALTGHWQASVDGIDVIGNDTLIICGVDTIDLNGVDFDISAGYIPFKTGAVLRMRASGNGVDTVFWNRDVYPTTVFSCVDYNNQTFFKTAVHTINADSTELLPARITELAIYSAHKTGADSVSLYSYFSVPAYAGYWVKKTGNDGTGTGSFLAPWLTIAKAYSTANVNSVINICSGVYKHATYLIANRNGMTLAGVGNVSIQSSNATQNIMFYDGAHYLYRLVLDGENAKSTQLYITPGAGGSYSPKVGSAFNIAIINSKVGDANSQCVIQARTNAVTYYSTISQCVIDRGVRTGTTGTGLCNALYNENLFKYISFVASFVNTPATHSRIQYCNLNNQFNVIGGDTIQYCTINRINTAANAQHGIYSATGARYSNLMIRGNTLNYTRNASTAYYGIDIESTNIIPLITGNRFINEELTQVVGTNYIIELGYCHTPTISNNYFQLFTRWILGAVSIVATDSVIGACKINYNEVWCKSLTGITISLGGETVKYDKFNGSEFIGNKLVGSYYYTPDSTSTNHHALLSGGINFTIKNNYISYSRFGIVLKAGHEGTYASGGIFYNVFRNNYQSIVVRGVKGVVVANCTFDNDGENYLYSVGFDEDDAAVGVQQSGNDTIINCIFNYTGASDLNHIRYDRYAMTNGGQVKSCAFYSNRGDVKVLNTGAGELSTSVAVDSGYFVSPTFSSPSYKSATQLWPTKMFYGTSLGATYDDGLDITTTWPDGIVTKPQGVKWLMGAYIYTTCNAGGTQTLSTGCGGTQSIMVMPQSTSGTQTLEAGSGTQTLRVK